MPEKIVKEDGTEVEVYTAEELEAQRQAAIEEYRLANPDKTEEFDALNAQLAEANAELEKLKTKDLNFSNLRAQKEAAEKAKDEALKAIDEKIGLVKKEILEGVLKDHYNETLSSLAGEDKELLKKIEFHYKRLQDPAATKEEVAKKLRDAWTLATRVEDANALNASVISSGGVRKLNIKGEQKFTPEEKAFAQKLAAAGGIRLEDKDFEK